MLLCVPGTIKHNISYQMLFLSSSVAVQNPRVASSRSAAQWLVVAGFASRATNVCFGSRRFAGQRQADRSLQASRGAAKLRMETNEMPLAVWSIRPLQTFVALSKRLATGVAGVPVLSGVHFRHFKSLMPIQVPVWPTIVCWIAHPGYSITG